MNLLAYWLARRLTYAQLAWIRRGLMVVYAGLAVAFFVILAARL